MKTKTIATIAFAVMLIVASAGMAVGNDEIRTVRDQATLTFEADGNYRQLDLRVTGEGQVVERSFQADQHAVFSPAEFNLPDGEYSFEVVQTPGLETVSRNDVREARANGSEYRGAMTSGTFRLERGSIVLDDGTPEADFGNSRSSAPFEAQASNDGLIAVIEADQVILDDLIVDGSACVGFDCVNGESFGFDTIRLKENNLRINFADTSNTASFPTNDWRILANDTTNGGASYLGIEDSSAGRMPFRVVAGARANALVVKDSRVGMGTLSPATSIHTKDGNTPTLRLEQDGSSGFGAQTWDVAGNEANFFIRDATNGSTLPFRIFPGAPSNALTIAATGRVGHGLTSPTSDVHVKDPDGDGFSTLRLTNGADIDNWDVRTTSSGGLAITKAGTGQIELEIKVDGSITCPVGNTINGVACTGN